MNRPPLEFVVPHDRLPSDAQLRHEILQNYFGERVPACTGNAEAGWRVHIDIPPTADYYVDSRILEGLNWWGCTVTDIPYECRRNGDILTALSDAWTLLSWSKWLSSFQSPPPRVTVIHLDDHDDLMTPRIAVRDKEFVDLLTGCPVAIGDPASVQDSIASGAIGMGSFIAPFLHAMPFVDLRHLCDTQYAQSRRGRYWLKRAHVADTFLQPGARRPSVDLVPISNNSPPPDSLAGIYRVSNDENALLADLEDGPILLHIDLDFFNNRFNWDSDWRDHPVHHDPPISSVMGRVENVLRALTALSHNIVDVSIGVSPGFFPAELWAPVCNKLVRGLARDSRRW